MMCNLIIEQKNDATTSWLLTILLCIPSFELPSFPCSRGGKKKRSCFHLWRFLQYSWVLLRFRNTSGLWPQVSLPHENPHKTSSFTTLPQPNLHYLEFPKSIWNQIRLTFDGREAPSFSYFITPMMNCNYGKICLPCSCSNV